MANTQINLNSKIEIAEDRNPTWVGLQGTVLEIYSEDGVEYANLLMSPDSLLQERQGKDYEYTAVHFKTDDLKTIDSLRAETEKEDNNNNEPNGGIVVDDSITLPSEVTIPAYEDVEEPEQPEDTVLVTIVVTGSTNDVNEVYKTVKKSEVFDTLAQPGDTYDIGVKRLYRVQGDTQSVALPLDLLQSVVTYTED